MLLEPKPESQGRSKTGTRPPLSKRERERKKRKRKNGEKKKRDPLRNFPIGIGIGWPARGGAVGVKGAQGPGK